jgi:hypothetical protein
MQRIKTKKLPDYIITGDWHLRETNPVCRIDDFWQTQWRKVDFISDLQKQYNCPVLHGGDLYDYWKPSPMLISETIKHLPNQFYTVYGNHDLPQHSLELKYKSGIYALECSETLSTFRPNNNFEFCHWGELPCNIGEKYLLWHVPTYQGKEPYPGCSDQKAATLLRKYPQLLMIITSDNHQPFVEEHEGRLLVNPGSIFRIDADQINHKPRVYLWYTETNTVEAVYLPIETDVISREHIEIKEQRDNRIDAFVSRLNTDYTTTLSFEKNLQEFEKVNNVRQPVMDIVYKSLEV